MQKINIGDLEIDIRVILHAIDEREAKVVGLQFPEGLVRHAVNISEVVRSYRDVEILLSGNTCFGACDIDVALLAEADILFHFAHTPQKRCEGVVYVEARSNLPVEGVVEKAVELLSGRRIGVVTTAQHVHKVKDTCRVLEDAGFTCMLGKGDSCISYHAQVLGCNFSAARVECDEYLYLGSGEFHPIGVAIATGKSVVVADPYTDSVFNVDPEPLIRRRLAVVARAFDAKRFGVIISAKFGQQRLKLARLLKDKIEQHGRQAFLISMDVVTPERLLGFKLDAFVNTACPRIAVDDSQNFHAPVLMPPELEIVLGEREKFAMDEITQEV
jgi:2-(3-amino-3-carboxypropyl)histidine synthase